MKRILNTVLVSIVILTVSTLQHVAAQQQTTKSNTGIAYNLAGEGDLIVFVHGSNLDQRMWFEQKRYFANSAKVLTYDLRGLGSSDAPSEPYSDVDDLNQLLDELGESELTLVGLSAGVQVALDFAALNPNKVNKLVLVSPSLNGYTPKENPPYLSELIKALRQSDFDQANEVLLNSEIMSVPMEHENRVREMVYASRQWSLRYDLIRQNPDPVISNLGDIVTPTLILIGEKDISAIKDLGLFLERELMNADLVTVPSGRHLLNLSSKAIFNEEIHQFIQ